MEQRNNQKTVLVVEDEALIRMSTALFLEDAGLQVLEAGNSAEALYVLGANTGIDVLLTDVRMPGVMDGLALVAKVRRDHPLTRCIVVSGNATPADACKAGAAGFLAKPYLARNVLKALLGLVPHNQTPLGFAA